MALSSVGGNADSRHVHRAAGWPGQRATAASGAASSPTETATATTAARTGRGPADPAPPRPGHEPGHGGGGMGQALVQALKGLGLAWPAADEDLDRTLRHDLHDFMHALYAALRGADQAGGAPPERTDNGTAGSAGHGANAVEAPANATGSTPSTAEDSPAARPAAALSALIARVGQGEVPQALQSAFNRLVGDLQRAVGVATLPQRESSGSASSTSPPSPTATPALKDVLSALQQGLSYADVAAGRHRHGPFGRGWHASGLALGNVLHARA